MNDINKFNNQYLKCIVTKYKSTFNGNSYLANSGALIVYHADSEKDSYPTKDASGNIINNEYIRNYVYLGDEFLASGWGFLCKDMRDKAEYIVKTYDDTINALKKADEDEQNNRKLEDNKLWENFEKYIAYNGGYIDKTKVIINGRSIDTKDILLYGEEAKYKNLEVTNIELRINGEICKDNIINLPLGTRIKNIDVYINYDINDSGGIDELEVLHKNLNYINSTSINGNEIEAVIIKYDQDSNGNGEEGIIHYKKIFTDSNPIYVTNKITDIIKGFYIKVKPTPTEKFKFYPRLKEKDIEIISTGNMIQENTIKVLQDITVIPYYSLCYKFVLRNELLTYNNIESNYNINTGLINKDNEIVIEDIPFQYADGQNQYTMLYIGIPSIYKIDKLYALDKDNYKYNWTGAILEKNTYVKLSTCKYTEGDKKYVTKYKLYRINDNNGFICSKIIIKVSLIDVLTYENIEELTYERLTQDLLVETGTNINDEEFNVLYWVNFSGTENYQNIQNTLNPLLDNASNK